MLDFARRPVCGGIPRRLGGFRRIDRHRRPTPGACVRRRALPAISAWLNGRALGYRRLVQSGDRRTLRHPRGPTSRVLPALVNSSSQEGESDPRPYNVAYCQNMQFVTMRWRGARRSARGMAWQRTCSPRQGKSVVVQEFAECFQAFAIWVPLKPTRPSVTSTDHPGADIEDCGNASADAVDVAVWFVAAHRMRARRFSPENADVGSAA